MPLLLGRDLEAGKTEVAKARRIIGPQTTEVEITECYRGHIGKWEDCFLSSEPKVIGTRSRRTPTRSNNPR